MADTALRITDLPTAVRRRIQQPAAHSLPLLCRDHPNITRRHRTASALRGRGKTGELTGVLGGTFTLEPAPITVNTSLSPSRPGVRKDGCLSHIPHEMLSTGITFV